MTKIGNLNRGAPNDPLGNEIKFVTPTYDPNKKRNAVDHMQWMKTDGEVIEYISKYKNNFSLLLLNIDYDNNTGSVIRSANIFGADTIYMYGRRKFNRRASVGAEFYSKMKQIKFVEQIDPIFKQFDQIIALENNVPQTTSLHTYNWDKDKKILICLGQEGNGLPTEILQKCDICLEIPQLGSIRSLNVASASSIVMYDYCLKTKAFDKLNGNT